MSYAPNYDVNTDFSADESTSLPGRSTVRTANLDNELDNISESINALNANLKLLQRSDGELLDRVVSPGALAPETVSLFSAFEAQGAWFTGTVYTEGDVVVTGGATFLCARSHTSGTFLTDLAAGLWLPLGPGVGLITLTDAASILWDVTYSPNAEVTLTASGHTMAAPTGLVTGVVYHLKVKQDNAGNRTVSWNAAFKWGTAGAPTLSTGSNAADLFAFLYDGTNLLNIGKVQGF